MLGRGARSLSTEVARHRPIMRLGAHKPLKANDVFVAPTATSSVWYGAVVRGDRSEVRLGWNSSIGDQAVVDNARSLPSGFPAKMEIGDHVVIQGGATLRSCIVENNVIVGSGSTIGEGALLETNSILEPGTVVEPGGRIPAGEKWGGNPARFITKLSDDEIKDIVKTAEAVGVKAGDCAGEYLPVPDAP